MVKCSLCGVREAVYYRYSSGHYLCSNCLMRVLEHGVRRYLSSLGALKPGSRVLIPITYYNTMASLGLADISLIMRRGYGSRVVVAVPDFVRLSVPERFRTLDTINVNVDPKPCYADPVLAIHFDKLWSLRLASLLGFNVILLPITRTDLTLLTVEIPLRGYDEAWSLLENVLKSSSVTLVNALASIEAEAIVSHAVISGYEADVLTKCSPKLETSRILRELRGVGPEVEFSSPRISELLLNIAKSRFKLRCSYCGGLSKSNVCRLCELVGASSVNVRTLSPGESLRT